MIYMVNHGNRQKESKEVDIILIMEQEKLLGIIEIKRMYSQMIWNWQKKSVNFWNMTDFFQIIPIFLA